MNQKPKHTGPSTNSQAAAYGYEAYSSSISKALYVESPLLLRQNTSLTTKSLKQNPNQRLN